MQEMIETEQTRWSLLDRFDHIPDDRIHRRAAEGTWTIAQVMDHLYLMERAIVAGIADTLAKAEHRPAEPKPFALTLDRTRSIDAPPQVMPTDTPKTRAELLDLLTQSREALIRTLDGAGEDALASRSFPHPVFGVMDVRQWIAFIGIHEQRHLAQIEEIDGRLTL